MPHENPVRRLSNFEWLRIQHTPCGVEYRRLKQVRKNPQPASTDEQVQQLAHSPIEIIRLKVHPLPLPCEDGHQ